MAISIEGEELGWIEIGLFGDVVPKTVANFATLCDLNSGALQKDGKYMSYWGTTFHTVIPGVLI